MVRKINQNGFSLIELLVVLAILAIALTIGAFSYREAMRTYRVKKAISDTKVLLNFARTISSKENSLVFVELNKGVNSYNFDVYLDDRDGGFNKGKDTFLRRLTIKYDSIDPGKPSPNIYYNFDQYVTLSTVNSLNLQSSIGTGENESGIVTEFSDIAFADVLTFTINQTGFIDFGKGFVALQFRSSPDIDENLEDRQYALLISKTGNIESYRYNIQNTTWEKY